jgi:serine/threonine protein kinase
LTLKQLIEKGLGAPPNLDTLKDMTFYYVSKIAGIVLMQDADTALGYYLLAADRPSSTTIRRIAQKTGVQFSRTATVLGGNVYFGSFHSVPMIVKKINDIEEMERMVKIVEDVRLLHVSLVPMQILEYKAESMLIGMPRMNGTVADLPFPVDPLGLLKIIETVLSALRHLDQYNFHHMDVKDQNIGLDLYGRAILIDLGSTAESDVLTYVTVQYVPTDLHCTAVLGKFRSRKEVDFWMLGVTVYYMLRGGAKQSPTPSRGECMRFLASFPDTNAGAETALAPLLEALKEV